MFQNFKIQDLMRRASDVRVPTEKVEIVEEGKLITREFYRIIDGDNKITEVPVKETTLDVKVEIERLESEKAITQAEIDRLKALL